MDDIALIDAGDGRRLERFGPHVADRPAPSATERPRMPRAWASADLVWDAGRWTRGDGTSPWCVTTHGLTLELRPAAGGQLGLFPDHASMWPWIRQATEAAVRAAAAAADPPAVLSLFAYTGGATLAAARAGAAVAHLDASKTAVAWARSNASASGLADAPIRWLVEDAGAFVRREIRRGRRYAGFIVDPPAYGHGPSGTDWRIERDLGPLLDGIRELRADETAFVLLTAHTPSHHGPRLGDLLARTFSVAPESGDLAIVAESGARLRLGAYARWRP
ncbi:MAG: class I SAM-dependent methyltransferase [Chloroflexota bacterium]